MSTSHRAHARTHLAAASCPRRPEQAVCTLSEYGVELVALRLRLLGQPTRLKLLRALDQQDATVADLARSISVEPDAVTSHLALLYRAGIVSRVERSGPAVYRLEDWPTWWLIEQFSLRLRTRTRELRAAVEDQR